MALSDKNILITPNIGQSADPKIEFKGADASTGAQTITLQVYPTSNGTLSFEGSAGQLFSITNSLSGTIYSVNDVSGIPSIEVLDTGLVKLAQYSGNILIGTGSDNGTDKLQVNGSILGTAIKGSTLTSTVATGTAPLTVTSTTKVTNLNADLLDGLDVHTGTNNEANKIVRTDGSGYLYTGYINSASGNEGNNSSPARVWGTNGSDAFLRTYLTSALSVNYAASSGAVSGLTLTSSAYGINPNSVTQNQIGYNTSVSLFGQTDGGLYSSAYSQSWIHQIYGDFRTGQIAIRGKNSGTWQAWRTVLDSSNYNSYAPTLTGTGASGTWGISITGNAATATDADTLDGNHASAFAASSHTHDYVPERNRGDWNDSTVIGNVVGQLAWKNYGNNHTIFDASAGTAPDGTAVNNTNPAVNWTGTYPTLMGWNGSSTYGVRVDVSRYADSAGSVTGTVAVANGGTGQTSLTANNVILGNGTSAVQFVAPSTNGNVLTSNGTTWVSQAPTSGVSTGKAIAMAMIFGG